MHDNPRATEEEQELTQTQRTEEGEDQRGGYSPDNAADEGEE